jgi:N utilization substance protein A
MLKKGCGISGDDITETTLEEARKVEPEAQLGDLVMVESTPKDFRTRCRANCAPVIQQRIAMQNAKPRCLLEKQLGEVVSGVVQAVGAAGLTIGLE